MATTDGSPVSAGLSFGFRQETRATIRQRIGRLMGKMVQADVVSADSTSFTASVISRFPDKRFVGWSVFVSSGAGIGQSAVITDSVQATGMAQVTPALMTPLNTTSRLELWHGNTDPEDVNESINLAILDAQQTVMVPRRVNPSSQSTDFLRLTVPPNLKYVSKVQTVSSSPANTWTEYRMVQSVGFLSEDPNGIALSGRDLYVKSPFPSDLPLSQIWLIGYGYPELLYTDSDLAEVRSDFLTYMGAFFQDAGLAEGSMLDPAEHSGRAGNWLRLALAIKAQMHNYIEPNTQEVF